MTWLDSAISWISPRAGWNRQMYREALRNYDAASSARPNAGWRGVNTTAEQTNAGSRDILRGNARDLERNSDELNSIVLPFERHVVGTGPRLQAKVRRANGEQDEELNAQLEADWLVWCKPRNCDVTAQQSFGEMLRMGIRRRRVDGATIFLKVYGTEFGFLPFALQAKEVDDLDTTYVGRAVNGNLIVAGIELNAYNRPVAYYFRKTTPDGFYIGAGAGDSIRVEANRVIMWWDRMRPSQIREVTMLAPSLTRVRDIREYLESVSVAKRIQACFAMFIERINPTQSMGRTADNARDKTSNYYGRTVTPGMIYEGQPGDKATAIAPPNTGSSERDFVTMQQRIAGAGQGLSYETTSRDVSQANYSSVRFNSLEDNSSYDIEFQGMNDHVLDEVHQEFIISEWVTGRVAMPNFWRDKQRYFAHDFIAPGRPWVDPLKEVKANTEAVRTGQDTIANICSARGLDWREVAIANAEAEAFAEQARKDAFAKLGLPYIPKGAPNGTAAATPSTGSAASA